MTEIRNPFETAWDKTKMTSFVSDEILRNQLVTSFRTVRCTIERTLKEKYQTEYNPKRLVTSIHTLSGPGTRKPAVFSSLLRPRWIDSVLTESDSAGLKKGVASRWWGGEKTDHLLGTYFCFLSNHLKQIQVTFMKLLERWVFCALRILGMSRLRCQVATCFESLFLGCHDRRVWWFHWRGQDTFLWNNLNTVMGIFLQVCWRPFKTLLGCLAGSDRT